MKVFVLKPNCIPQILALFFYIDVKVFINIDA